MGNPPTQAQIKAHIERQIQLAATGDADAIKSVMEVVFAGCMIAFKALSQDPDYKDRVDLLDEAISNLILKWRRRNFEQLLKVEDVSKLNGFIYRSLINGNCLPCR